MFEIWAKEQGKARPGWARLQGEIWHQCTPTAILVKVLGRVRRAWPGGGPAARVWVRTARHGQVNGAAMMDRRRGSWVVLPGLFHARPAIHAPQRRPILGGRSPTGQLAVLSPRVWYIIRDELVAR